MDKSSLITKYNVLRKYFPKRIQKALSLAQHPQERPYYTTPTSCTCPDFALRGSVCKHILALHLASTYKLHTGDQVTKITDITFRSVIVDEGRDIVELLSGELADRNILIAL